MADLKKIPDDELFAEAKRRTDERVARETAERLAKEAQEAAAQVAFLELFMKHPEAILGIVSHSGRCTDKVRSTSRRSCLRCALLTQRDEDWSNIDEPIILKFKSSY